MWTILRSVWSTHWLHPQMLDFTVIDIMKRMDIKLAQASPRWCWQPVSEFQLYLGLLCQHCYRLLKNYLARTTQMGTMRYWAPQNDQKWVILQMKRSSAPFGDSVKYHSNRGDHCRISPLVSTKCVLNCFPLQKIILRYQLVCLELFPHAESC